ncbi:MAG: redoxin domain-containing protein [Bacteriovoracaceae bacterium]|nr:redoxin domain-containing protein [Bacteriovoracaceae bacterium]
MKKIIFQLTFMTLLLTTFWPDVGATDGPHYFLQKMGFSIFTTPAKNFKLNNLDGKPVSLEQYKGKWIFITFWATWCGTCHTEIPALQRLHQQFKNQNVVILGVSIDTSNIEDVKKLIKSAGVSFPILLDDKNEVVTSYRAHSIPSMYVISPDWKIVGLTRSAANWDSPSIVNSLKQLITFKTVKDVEPEKMTIGGGAISIPKELVPPSIKISMVYDNYLVGEVIPMDVLVSWSGDARQYTFKEPKLFLPKNVLQKQSTSESNTNILGSTKRYKFPLIINEVGEYELGPVELSYRSRFGKEDQYFRAPAVKISVITGAIDPKLYIYLLPALGVILVLSLAWALFLKRLKKRNSELIASMTSDYDFSAEINALFATKNTSLGNKYEVELLELYWKILKDAKADRKQQDEAFLAIEKTKIVGQRLSPEEVSYFENQIKKFIKDTKE